MITSSSNINNLSQLTDFNFDLLMDLVRILPERSENKNNSTVEVWQVICALMAENANKSSFFTRNQTVTLSDVKLLLSKLPSRQDFGDEVWNHII